MTNDPNHSSYPTKGEPSLHSTLRDIPFSERPRERLLEHGSRALSDAELVAVLLRTGRPGATAVAIAHELLASSGGLGGLLGARPESLRREGLGKAKIATVLAAVEVGRRLAERRVPLRSLLARPAAVAEYLTLRYRIEDQEVMGALFVDSRHALIAEREVFRGTLTRAAVEPRTILKEALLRGAAGVILFHTHPSGDPDPSAEDFVFTRRMVKAGEIVGIRVVDHLVLGTVGHWVSLKQREAW